MATISYAHHVRTLADEDPDRLVLTVVGDRSLTRRDLVVEADAIARRLVAAGVGEGDHVTIAHPNGVEFMTTTLACWFIGAVPQPVSPLLPRRELLEIVDLADAKVVAGATVDHGRTRLEDVAPVVDDEPLPDAVSPIWKSGTSGGSTGRPKLIRAGTPSVLDPETPSLLIHREGTLVMPGPLYHAGPFVWAWQQVFHRGHTVILERFDPVHTLAAVEEHSACVLYQVPTMMQRIWKLPEAVRSSFDVSSIQKVWHLAAPCPDWLKAAWIEWLGPEKILELYATTEGMAATAISGVDWLEHRGSVGKPTVGEIRILRPDGTDCEPGEHGEVFMRAPAGATTYEYVGADPDTNADGWTTLGDMGWMDADGYLYLGDRKKDMILSGGANIYPAEVEAAIDRHPAVSSCAVLGIPDDDMGHRIHAVVHATAPLTEDELRTFLVDELVRYKLPRTFEFVDEPVRDDAGKVRRSRLAADRT